MHDHDHGHSHEHGKTPVDGSTKNYCDISEKCTKCKCPCHKVVGLAIALIGLSFLLANLGFIEEQHVRFIWPSCLILIGLKKSFGKGRCKCCAKS